jgi:hypothetical protein
VGLAEWIQREIQTRRDNDWPRTVGGIIYNPTVDDGTSFGIVISVCHFLRAIVNGTTSKTLGGSTYGYKIEILFRK